MKLYPKNLVTNLDKAAKSVVVYEKLWQTVLDEGYKAKGQVNFNIWALLKALGFEVVGNYDDAHLAPMKQFFEELKKTDPELAKQFPIKGREVLTVKAEIYNKLIDFFSDNQLEETQDSSLSPSFYGRFP